MVGRRGVSYRGRGEGAEYSLEQPQLRTVLEVLHLRDRINELAAGADVR